MPVHADPVYVDPQNEPGVEREKMLRVVMMLCWIIWIKVVKVNPYCKRDNKIYKEGVINRSYVIYEYCSMTFLAPIILFISLTTHLNVESILCNKTRVMTWDTTWLFASRSHWEYYLILLIMILHVDCQIFFKILVVTTLYTGRIRHHHHPKYKLFFDFRGVW